MATPFTERELDIITVIWDRGPSTASEVREELAERGTDLAYNTVLTLLRIMEEKGHVDHEEEGRAHRFGARVQKSEAGASALARTVDRLFGGSAEALVAQLVQQRGLTKDELRRLREVVDQQLTWRTSGGGRSRPRGSK